MAIYRGPGGPGDATNDASNQAILAAASAVAAANSEASAAASAVSASTSATNAANSAAEALSTVSNKANINGDNATGTWPISVSGNAGTVTNGVYTTVSYSNPAWVISLDETKVLPSQTSNTGKYLKTDGTSTSWATVDALPNQTGNSGKYLTTNGTAASWATLNVDPNSTTKGLYEHANTINVAYSITSGNNAMSAGPVTIGSSGSVTIPDGSTWTVV